jgi:DNA gyrase/topoisomerase IV subunit B
MLKLSDIENNFLEASHWLGGKGLATADLRVVLGEGLCTQKVSICPAAYGIVQELLINVYDQTIRHSVKSMHVNINKNIVEVVNEGPGFNITFIPQLQMWSPFYLALFPFQGTQTNGQANTNSLTGGVNGTGLKVALRFCRTAKIATVDATTNRFYELHITHRGEKWLRDRPSEAIIKGTTFSLDKMPFNILVDRCVELTTPTTFVSGTGVTKQVSALNPFTYIYMELDTSLLNAPDMCDLARVLEGRLYELNQVLTAPIHFNSSLLPSQTFEEFARQLSPGPVVVSVYALMDPDRMGDIRKKSPPEREAITRDTTLKLFPIELQITLTRNASSTYRWASINGVVLNDGTCQLFKHFIGLIVSGLTKNPLLTGKDDFIRRHLCVFIKGMIARPKWQSQNKNGGTFTVDSGFYSRYVLPDCLDRLVKPLLELFKAHSHEFEIKEIKEMLKSNSKFTSTYAWSDCIKARSKNWADRSNTRLFLPEGTSAETNLLKGIRSDKSPIHEDCFGMFPFRGVPANSRRSFLTEGNTRLPDKDLIRNQVWNGFVFALGLDYYKKYESDMEFRTLRYGGVVIVTDEDDDGKGKITCLILNHIEVFWPALIKRGYIARLETDLIKVFSTSGRERLLKSFSNEQTYRQWAFEQGYFKLLCPDDEFQLTKLLKEFLPDKWNEFRQEIASRTPLDPASNEFNMMFEVKLVADIKSRSKPCTGMVARYYKGLGGHTPQMMAEMMAAHQYHKRLYHFIYDDRAPQLFEQYFNDNPENRKVLLRRHTTPDVDVRFRTIDGAQEMGVTCSSYLEKPFFDYCKVDHKRKLPSVYDNLNDVRRRTWYGALVVLKGLPANTQMKVEVLASKIAEVSSYHHGITGIIDAIIGFGQTFFGGCRLPLFLPFGSFGSRQNPEAAAARYINVKLNRSVALALYPWDDIPILEFLVEEAERTVPKYFCSIIPPIFETINMPSHGWQINIHAHTLQSLIDISRCVIDDTSYSIPQLDTNGWKGYQMVIGDVHYTFGRFRIEGDYLIVCELPMGMSGTTWINWCMSLGQETVQDGQKKTTRIVEHPFIESFDSGSIGNLSDQKPLSANEICMRFRFRKDVILSYQSVQIRGQDVSAIVAITYSIGLYSTINHQRNYMDEHGSVLEFTSYGDVIARWKGKRIALYKERGRRKLIISTIEYCILNDIRKALRGRGKSIVRQVLDAESMSDDEMEKLLEENGLMRFNASRLDSKHPMTTNSIVFQCTGYYTMNAFISTYLAKNKDEEIAEELIAVAKICGEDKGATEAASKCGYDHLFNIQIRNMRGSGEANRLKKMSELLDVIRAELNPENWKQTWRNELEELVKIARDDLPQLWQHKILVDI